MRYRSTPITVLILLVSLLTMSLSGAETIERRKVVEAMIVSTGVPLTRQLTAFSVVDAKELSELETLFPEFGKRPKSDTAGSWIAAHRVYVTFSDGDTIRVITNPDGNLWSTGNGDFATNGDFLGFVKRLKK